MLEKFAYYWIILPISRLPFRVLYRFSNFMYFLFTTIVPYRRWIIDRNIGRSFPEMTKLERKQLRFAFYRHFCDLVGEGVKNLTISKSELRKRVVVRNPELMQDLYERGKDVILVSGHYNNWEWMITSQNLLFPHQAYGLGKKLSSGYYDRKVNARRERFGMKVIHSGNYKQKLSEPAEKPRALLVLADQAPSNPRKSYWMSFLGQPTPILFGTELIAHEFDYAVVFFLIHKVKRGHYEVELKLITDEPRKMDWGQITEGHVRLLEDGIRQAPEFWLWSHKRWKREVPANLETLKMEQKKYFEARFDHV